MAGAGKRIKRGEMIVFVVILGTAAVLLVAWTRGQHERADFATATKKMSSVALALLEFEADFGSFPSDATRQNVIDATGNELGPTTGTANDYFRQLIAYGIQSEDIFLVPHPEAAEEPDRIVSPLTLEALKPGEVGISYGYGLHSESNPERPLLMAPMKSGTHLAHRTLGNRVAIWFVGGHQYPCTVDRTGEILLPDGTRLFDPSRPVWQNRPIDIRHPEFRK